MELCVHMYNHTTKNPSNGSFRVTKTFVSYTRTPSLVRVN